MADEEHPSPPSDDPGHTPNNPTQSSMLDHLKSRNDYSLFIQEVNNVNSKEGVDEDSTHEDNLIDDVTPTVSKVLDNLQSIKDTGKLRPATVNFLEYQNDDDEELHLMPPLSQRPTTEESRSTETRWQYYKTRHDDDSSDDNNNEVLTEDDPYISLLRESGVLNPSPHGRHLPTIEEGIEPCNKEDDVCSYLNDKFPHEFRTRQADHQSHLSNKRWRGRLQSEDRKHKNIIRALKQNNGIYRVQINQEVQNDPGANICITDNKSLLFRYSNISPKAVNGCSKDGPALQCEGVGYLPWYAKGGERLMIRTYYSSTADGTIFSPTAIQQQYKDRYSGWCFKANCDDKVGTLRFNARDGITHTVFESYMENRLWFHYLQLPSAAEIQELKEANVNICRKLNSDATFELWHNRLGHPGRNVTEMIHLHAKGIPKLNCNRFY